MSIKKFRRFVCITLSILMVMSNFIYADAAKADVAKCPDIVGNKYEAQLREWVDNGFITGDQNGNFLPDKTISRAEFMTLVNRSFGFTDTTEINYSDVTKDKWFYKDAAIAVKMGYMQGSNGKLTPQDPISRQEFATVLVRLTGSTPAVENKIISGLADSKSIPAWSTAAISTAISKGFFEGFIAKNFKPAESISKLEAAVVLDRAFKGIYKAVYMKKGEYGPASGMQTLEGSVVIVSPDVTLKNTTVNGDLILRETIGDGNVYLDNVAVKGTTIVKGGGEHSIVIRNSSLGKVVVRREGNTVRIVATGSTTIGEVNMQSSATLQEEFLTGTGFGDIVIPDDIFAGANVVFEGVFDDIQVDSSNVNINVGSGTIGSLTLTQEAAGTTVNLSQQASVNTLNANAAVNITGQGAIQTANVNAPGVTIQQQPQNTVTAPGVNLNTSPPTTPAPTQAPQNPPSSGGSSGGGGGGDGDEGDRDRETVQIVSGINDTTIMEKTFKDITISCNPNNASISASSSNASVATVSIAGNVLRVTGVVPGTADITVNASRSGYYSSSRIFRVTVTLMPTVEIDTIADVTMWEKTNRDITVVNTTANITFSTTSDNTNVATASMTGNTLTVRGIVPGAANISVTASKAGYYSVTRTFKVTVMALHTDATLKDLVVNGTTIAGFNPDILNYTVQLPAGTTAVPEVVWAVTDTGLASAVLTSAANLPGTATILVTAHNGITKKTYTVNFQVKAILNTNVSNPEKGTINPIAGNYDIGESITITASPLEDYVIGDVSISNGGNPVTYTRGKNTITFTMPLGIVDVNLAFAKELLVKKLSSTRSNQVDTSKNTINNFGWFSVVLGSPLDLSAESKGNFAISYEYSTDNGATWEQAKKADSTVFFKDKTWSGYLNNADGISRYPNPGYSGDIVPAEVPIMSNETKVGERVPNVYDAILDADAVVKVRTVLDITDNYGNKLDPIKFEPVTYTNRIPDKVGIGIYDQAQTGEYIVIKNINDLKNAVNNQANGQYWAILPGTYDVPRDTVTKRDNDGKVDEKGQPGWCLPITANGLTVIGVGNPVITSSDTTPNGAWASQNLITVWGDDVTFKGLTITPKVAANKSVEVVGDKKFSAENCTFTVNTSAGASDKKGGSLYFNGRGVTGTKEILIKNNTFNYASVAFDGVAGNGTSSIITVEGNTFENIGVYAVGNTYWGSTDRKTVQYADVYVNGNQFKNVTDATNIIAARLNQTFRLDEANTINGSPINKDEFEKYINFDNLANWQECKNNKVIVAGREYESPYKSIAACITSEAQLEAAINAAGTNDTILVAAKTYNIGKTQLLINKGITLRGIGETKPIIRATAYDVGSYTEPMLKTTANNPEGQQTIIENIVFDWQFESGFTVKGNGNAAMLAGNNVTVRDCEFKGTNIPPNQYVAIVSIGQTGGTVGPNVDANKIVFKNNKVDGTISIVRSAQGKVLDAEIKDNEINPVNMEGIWTYVLSADDILTISGNIITDIPGDFTAIKLMEAVASVNGSAEYTKESISAANDGASVKLNWIGEAADVDTLKTAIANAKPGDTVLLAAGDYTITETINVNKPIIVKGAANFATKITTSGKKPVFNLSAAATLDRIFINKTDSDDQHLVTITANNCKVLNSKFTGTYEQGNGQTTRAVVPNAGITGYTLSGNYFESLRQPAYLEGAGTVTGNFVKNTRGWVVCVNHPIAFTGNTFEGNAVDIAIIANKQSHSDNYNDIAAISEANNGAYVENQLIKASAKNGKLVVEDGENEYINSVNNAVAAANEGDTIMISNGDFEGFSINNKKNLTIVGVGPNLTAIEPTALIASGIAHKYTANMKASVVVDNSTGIEIKGITISGNGLHPDAMILWNKSTGKIENSEIVDTTVLDGGQTGQGIAVDGSTGITSIDINNVLISGFHKNAVDIVDGNGATSGSTATITVNMTGGTITGAGATGTIAQNGIMFWDRAGGTLSGTISGVRFADIFYTGDNTAFALLDYRTNRVPVVSVQSCEFDSVQGQLYPVMNIEVDDGFDADTPYFGVTAFDNPKDAMENIGDGGTISIAAGIYELDESFAVNKSVKINGAGAGATIIKAPAKACAVISANNVTLEGIGFEGTWGIQVNENVEGTIVKACSIMLDNDAQRGEGALRFMGGNGTVNVSDTTMNGTLWVFGTVAGQDISGIVDNTIDYAMFTGIGYHANNGVASINMTAAELCEAQKEITMNTAAPRRFVAIEDSAWNIKDAIVDNGAGLAHVVEKAADNATITLRAETYELGKILEIKKPMTITGNGEVILKPAAGFDIGTQTPDKNLIGITGVKGSVKLENLIVEGSLRNGINVFESDNVVLNNITSRNNAAAGLVVNNSVVVADNLNTSGNVWGYGVNVDKGSNPSAGAPATKFKLTGNGVIREVIQIKSDKSIDVTVDAAGYTGYRNAGSTVTIWSKTPIEGTAAITKNGITVIYASIQAALDDADTDDIINVKEGPYEEQLNISQSVTLDGNGSIISKGIKITADDVTVKDLTVTPSVIPDSGDTAGIYVTGTGILITDVIVEGTATADDTERGIIGTTGAGYAVTGCTISNVMTGIYANALGGESVTLEVTENTFSDCLAGIGGTENTILGAIEDNTFNSCNEGIGLGEGVSCTANGTNTLIDYLLANTFNGMDEADYVVDYRTPESDLSMQVETLMVGESTDTTAPAITLLGDATITLTVGSSYEEAGATAADEQDGDLTANIVIEGTVDTATEGTYTITYKVSDAAGNEAEVTRTVIVAAETGETPVPAPEESTGEEEQPVDETVETGTGEEQPVDETVEEGTGGEEQPADETEEDAGEEPQADDPANAGIVEGQVPAEELQE